MLNVKKISIIKAAVFGLVLSNAGFAAGEVAGPGEPLHGAAVAAPVVSPFLMSLKVDDLDCLSTVVYNTFSGAMALIVAREETLEESPGHEIRAEVMLEDSNQKFKGISLSERDKNILCIVNKRPTNVTLNFITRASIDALKNIFTPELEKSGLFMGEQETQLWIKLFWRFQWKWSGEEILDEIKAYQHSNRPVA